MLGKWLASENTPSRYRKLFALFKAPFWVLPTFFLRGILRACLVVILYSSKYKGCLDEVSEGKLSHVVLHGTRKDRVKWGLEETGKGCGLKVSFCLIPWSTASLSVVLVICGQWQSMEQGDYSMRKPWSSDSASLRLGILQEWSPIDWSRSLPSSLYVKITWRALKMSRLLLKLITSGSLGWDLGMDISQSYSVLVFG